MTQLNKLNPSDYEVKWQSKWQKERIYQPDIKNARRPYYNLMMFPYPSAEGLHVGNVYAFTGADINGRYQRMKGNDVFEPIGLDGFGIHSENYAIKIGKHPADQAKISEKHFYRQLHQIGNGFAWENILETYDPDYYKWTQWIFVQMFKHGLAYRKKSPVNFCPSCKTVLSDEQVIDGVCERCKSKVEKKEMEQWFFRITNYAEKLLQNTYKKDFHWTEKVKIGQRNWIGKKEGINITYTVVISQGDKLLNNKKKPVTITCFTTRPDTNFGATFVVIGPEHPFINVILNLFQDPKGMPKQVRHDRIKEIKGYVEKSKNKSEADRIAKGREKTGVFTGYYAINQLNNYKMPVYISDFVLGNVGTGAVVGVPGHDLRDFQFARKFNLDIKRVVVGKDEDKSEITKEAQVQEEKGKMINSDFLNGKDIHEATKSMMDYLEVKGWGKRVTSYKLRDWCISRQRYWGAPIPMILCDKCRWNAVPEDQLPVLLPLLSDWKPEGTGKGPLAKVKEFVNVKCPQCGSAAQRETDVCDTFLDSSWYHLRYPSINSYKKKTSPSPSPIRRGDLGVRSFQLPWDSQITKKWLPVTQYIGGAEHTVLHLLYARFITMAFHEWGILDFDEPFSRFYAHGLIIAEGAKMSKSRGNVIVPDEYIKKYGADTLRSYLMFLGPYDAGGDFRDTGIAGMYRFLGRVWRLVQNYLELRTKNLEQLSDKITLDGDRQVSHRGTRHDSSEVEESVSLVRFMHKTIKEVTKDMENFRYNTAIAHIMEYINEISNIKNQKSNIPKEVIETLLLLLAPFAPHMTEELWFTINQEPSTKNQEPKKRVLSSKSSVRSYVSIHLHPWPKFDPQYLVEDMVTIIVQINGKLRETLKLRTQNSELRTDVEKAARTSEKVVRYLSGKVIRKVIFVPGKLINFVV